MSSDVTDDQIQALAATAKPFSVAQLRRTADRHRDGVEAVELEHQRRMMSLRAGGVIAILCPINSDIVAGIAIMTDSPERAQEIMADDPCVQAGSTTCEVLRASASPATHCPSNGYCDPVA